MAITSRNLTESLTVLLVEDHQSDILLARRAFKKVDLTSILNVVEDGDAAIAYLSGAGEYGDRDRHPLPELLLLDLKMPRRSGFEVLQWLEQQPQLEDLPVVVLTSSQESGDVERARSFGIHSYLIKPITPTCLLAIVKSLTQLGNPNSPGEGK